MLPIIKTESIDEYRFLLRCMLRFMKEQGFYKKFIEITLRSFSSSKEHFETIYEFQKSGVYGWNSFFYFTPYVGNRYREYRGVFFLDTINKAWQKYLEDNDIEKKFEIWKRSEIIKKEIRKNMGGKM